MTASLEWHFSQVFGERTPGEEIQDADIISAVEFDGDGEFLATGDHGGRVVLFERCAPSHLANEPADSRPASPRIPNAYEYRYLTEFQSHEPEFDYLKSLEIEEKINSVRWCRRDSPALETPTAHHLLTTNDKTIKLWKVYEKQVLSVSGLNMDAPGSSGQRPSLEGGGAPPSLKERELRVPTVEGRETLMTSKCRRTYSNAHAYHINTVSLSSDKETFLSADDLRINLWNLDAEPQAYTVVDVKPANMDDLTEVITRAAFHPTHSHQFAYSTSRGSLRLADLRAAALCDAGAKHFEDAGPGGPKNFFSEIISSISDFRFSADGRHLLARDFMTVKLWDLAMDSGPLEVHRVHESLRSRLCDLYESDSLFDKFDVGSSGDGRHIATGSYSNFFKVFDRSNEAGSMFLESSRDPMRRRLQAAAKPASRFGLSRTRTRTVSTAEESVTSDLSSKVLRLSWHPQAPVIATAAANSLYLFQGRAQDGGVG
ncbi:PP2A1 [Auxenochlorella protothecoides x Auxenochlorella symbiontica]|uniref:Serine/threonine-protein phosphatase 2A 55 kDa regulatory subunit B n=1 Tax=Auxenochlorella protothecoides TaxID=3075 RepID=A0A087SSL4_AUXPR|nr:Serine/threonine protein phosphatase 2A 55 kDa regulatory subunit B beta isoform [Auxenochlorella protothecoides]KFM28718.1 Serine/threonine protein phosphatase 2A 55 kDa regulatory subunit B beta isoform [Auxenochlorella protothecoides]RMZ55598.1 hypothetical protein APUTEX25_000181 [Auxenochlorella protothecoides]|eukprot:RMZ55598.1 hypothetical protein APUTEX25_000181 [Auxenochlorella protothecoides]